MIIHVVRLINRQRHIKDLVESVFNLYRRGIEMNVPGIIQEFRNDFETDTNTYKSYMSTSKLIFESKLKDIDPQTQVHQWDDVLPHLYPAVSKIEVKEINGGSADTLNYYDRPEKMSVIAIGGDKLSRGLTLEGLSISYFLRTSKMYDTLLQMGRWFGYRGGYVDLCRLFTTRELNEWFCHITRASEDLREQFDYMSDVAGSTPEKYALGVRTHPGVLQISASNKIRSAVKIKIDWSGTLVESYLLSKLPDIVKSNFDSTTNFLNVIEGDFIKAKKGSYLWKNVSYKQICDFLTYFNVHEDLRRANPALLVKFINSSVQNREFTSWNVAVISKISTDKDKRFALTKNDLNVGYIERRPDVNQDKYTDGYYIRKSHIISPNDEFVDLTDEEYKTAMELTKAEKGEGALKYPRGSTVRNTDKFLIKPLLLIYFLDPLTAGLEDTTYPVIGFAIRFPKSKFGTAVEFAIHEQLLDKFNKQIDNEDYEDDIESDE